jgi:hypothetical protein
MWYDANISEDLAASIFRVNFILAAMSFRILVSYYITTWHHNAEDHDMNVKH